MHDSGRWMGTCGDRVGKGLGRGTLTASKGMVAFSFLN